MGGALVVLNEPMEQSVHLTPESPRAQKMMTNAFIVHELLVALRPEL